MARYGFAGMFWKAVPRENWPEDQETIDSIEKSWQEPFGDMRQELVFIGQGLSEHEVRESLNKCLISDDDLLKGKDYWATLADPFVAES